MTESFKIATVGPSRVGKTTLITAVLTDTRRMLAGSNVGLVPVGATEVVVNDNRDAMLGALTSGQFNAEAIKSTQDPRRYELVLRAGGRKNCLDIGFNILDYPGSWLSPAFRARNPEAEVDWDECVAHIEDSVMLLLPIDASVVMEAHTQPQKRAIPSILEISTVTDMVSFWLKRRMDVPDEPAVLVLAPLKCEKYFSDNGGRGTNSGLLKERVQTYYADALDYCAAATRPVRIVYAPVDTYGCVELMDSEWSQDESTNRLAMSGRYRVRGERKLAPKGAGVVVQELCRCLARAQEAEEAVVKAYVNKEREGNIARQTQRKGFWGTIGYYVSGEAAQVAKDVSGANATLEQIQYRQQELQTAVTQLSALPNDTRIELWSRAE